MDVFKYVVIYKDERIDVAGFGNYSIEALAYVILDGSAGTSYGYLTDCLRERLDLIEIDDETLRKAKNAQRDYYLESIAFSCRHENGGDRD